MAASARDRVVRDRAVVIVVHRGDGLGFRLAGVEVKEVEPGDEESSLRAIRARHDVGVVAVEQGVLDAAEPPVGRRRGDGLPVVIPFALPRRWAEPGRGRDVVAAIVRRAVGYHVKLGGTRT